MKNVKYGIELISIPVGNQFNDDGSSGDIWNFLDINVQNKIIELVEYARSCRISIPITDEKRLKAIEKFMTKAKLYFVSIVDSDIDEATIMGLANFTLYFTNYYPSLKLTLTSGCDIGNGYKSKIYTVRIGNDGAGYYCYVEKY